MRSFLCFVFLRHKNQPWGIQRPTAYWKSEENGGIPYHPRLESYFFNTPDGGRGISPDSATAQMRQLHKAIIIHWQCSHCIPPILARTLTSQRNPTTTHILLLSCACLHLIILKYTVYVWWKCKCSNEHVHTRQITHTWQTQAALTPFPPTHRAGAGPFWMEGNLIVVNPSVRSPAMKENQSRQLHFLRNLLISLLHIWEATLSKDNCVSTAVYVFVLRHDLVYNGNISSCFFVFFLQGSLKINFELLPDFGNLLLKDFGNKVSRCLLS